MGHHTIKTRKEIFLWSTKFFSQILKQGVNGYGQSRDDIN